MKRLFAILLAMLMLCACVAQAAEWADGKSPSKPYSGVPEVNLSENIGYMMFYPNPTMRIQYACQRLFIYLPREDVKAGNGQLHLYTQEDGEIWSTMMSNPIAVTVRPATEEELTGLMWGSGTCFEIKLPKTLELNKYYYVNLERNCIVTLDGMLDNPEVGGTTDWGFTVGGMYGVSGMEYLRDGETALYPMAGDTIRFNLVLGGDAVQAVLFAYNDSVNFPLTLFTYGGEITGSVSAGSPAWGVIFLDAEGNELQIVEFY